MDKADLMDLGLGKSEAEIYLALIRLGKSTSTELTKETGIHRSYIYDILEKLREKGLVSQIKEGGKQYFLPAEPERLKDYLNEKIDIFNRILPELNKLKKSKAEETSVEVYKGRQGLKILLNDMINEAKDYFAFGVIHYFEDERFISKTFVDQWLRRMNHKNVKERMILEKGTHVSPTKNSEFRYLPKEYLFTSSFIIYGDKVAIFVWEEPLLQILIKNKEIAKSYITQFNTLWKIAKK